VVTGGRWIEWEKDEIRFKGGPDIRIAGYLSRA
jgi:hypothetical protein